MTQVVFCSSSESKHRHPSSREDLIMMFYHMTSFLWVTTLQILWNLRLGVTPVLARVTQRHRGLLALRAFVAIYIGCLLITASPANSASSPGKHFIQPNLPSSLN